MLCAAASAAGCCRCIQTAQPSAQKKPHLRTEVADVWLLGCVWCRLQDARPAALVTSLAECVGAAPAGWLCDQTAAAHYGPDTLHGAVLVLSAAESPAALACHDAV